MKNKNADSGNLTTKPSNWTDFYAGAPIKGSPIYDGDEGIYFGADNGTFYKIDYSSGGVYWTFQTNGPIRTISVAVNNKVYFGSDDGNFYGLDAVTGQLLNNFPVSTGGEIRGSPFYYGVSDYIYFGSNDGKVYCIDLSP